MIAHIRVSHKMETKQKFVRTKSLIPSWTSSRTKCKMFHKTGNPLEINRHFVPQKMEFIQTIIQNFRILALDYIIGVITTFSPPLNTRFCFSNNSFRHTSLRMSSFLLDELSHELNPDISSNADFVYRLIQPVLPLVD